MSYALMYIQYLKRQQVKLLPQATTLPNDLPWQKGLLGASHAERDAASKELKTLEGRKTALQIDMNHAKRKKEQKPIHEQIEKIVLRCAELKKIIGGGNE